MRKIRPIRLAFHAERYFPPDFVYIPTITQKLSKRERFSIVCGSWIVAILCHLFLFWVVGSGIDAYYAKFDVQMAWSEEPLTGFGMMDSSYFDDLGEEIDEPPPEVEPTVDPFVEDEVADTRPTFDPNSIVIPDPEPSETDVATDEPAKPQKPYDLSQQPEKLQAVRRDIESMPDLHVLAPGNAKLIVLIRNDRVIGSRFENSIRRLYRAFPDYRFALGHSDIDPIRDIQAMLIATANPQLYAETFLVVSHQIPEEKLKSSISSSFPTRLTWSTHRDRPLATPDNTDGKYNPRSGIYKRSLYLTDSHTVLFLRPEVLPTLDVAHVDAVVHTRDEDLEQNPEQIPTFLESLGGLSLRDSDSMPTLFLMAQGIEGIQLGANSPDFEVPYAISGSMSTADRPHLNLVARFKTAEAARVFVEKWPELVQAVSSLKVPGVAGLVGALAVADEGESVFITGDLNGAMITLILMFAANHLESNA